MGNILVQIFRPTLSVKFSLGKMQQKPRVGYVIPKQGPKWWTGNNFRLQAVQLCYKQERVCRARKHAPGWFPWQELRNDLYILMTS